MSILKSIDNLIVSGKNSPKDYCLYLNRQDYEGVKHILKKEYKGRKVYSSVLLPKGYIFLGPNCCL